MIQILPLFAPPTTTGAAGMPPLPPTPPTARCAAPDDGEPGRDRHERLDGLRWWLRWEPRKVWGLRPVITTASRYEFDLDGAHTAGAVWGLRHARTEVARLGAQVADLTGRLEQARRREAAATLRGMDAAMATVRRGLDHSGTAWTVAMVRAWQPHEGPTSVTEVVDGDRATAGLHADTVHAALDEAFTLGWCSDRTVPVDAARLAARVDAGPDGDPWTVLPALRKALGGDR